LTGPERIDKTGKKGLYSSRIPASHKGDPWRGGRRVCIGQRKGRGYKTLEGDRGGGSLKFSVRSRSGLRNKG